MHGAGHPHHPTMKDPLASIYSLCLETGWRPDQVLSMPAHLLYGYLAYAKGVAEGKAVPSTL